MSEHNPFPDEGNTGHIWDDNLRELANPPPNWWMMAWYASVAFCIGYVLIYPSIPLVSSHFKGLTGWTAIKEYKADLAEVEAVRKPYEDKIAAMSAKEILADEELQRSQEKLKWSEILKKEDCLFAGEILALKLSFPT